MNVLPSVVLNAILLPNRNIDALPLASIVTLVLPIEHFFKFLKFSAADTAVFLAMLFDLKFKNS
jgi:hypothetical protein